MAAATLSIRMDTREAMAVLAELQVKFKVNGDVAEFRDLFLDIRKLLFEAPGLFFAERVRASALGAGEFTVALKPTDRLVELMTAIRAVERDFEVIND